ncbi:MAG: hypothetical protein CM15mP1_0860 [Methanobacteriota archaeon]|nr:MAG: hypothetical protein CM15mP1_0860 [Euryarchaeota archaeon]
MGIGGEVVEEHTPPSIFIELNQSQVKAPHLCKFEDCTRPRRGYNDFCRQHRAIGKIISGKIARAKAIAEIDARDKSNEVTEVNRTGSQQKNRHRKKQPFLVELLLYSVAELVFASILLLLMLPFMILG